MDYDASHDCDHKFLNISCLASTNRVFVVFIRGWLANIHLLFLHHIPDGGSGNLRSNLRILHTYFANIHGIGSSYKTVPFTGAGQLQLPKHSTINEFAADRENVLKHGKDSSTRFNVFTLSDCEFIHRPNGPPHTPRIRISEFQHPVFQGEWAQRKSIMRLRKPGEM